MSRSDQPDESLQHLVTLLNRCAEQAFEGALNEAWGHLREAGEFAATRGLEKTLQEPAVKEHVREQCARLATRLTDDGFDDIASEVLQWQSQRYGDDFYLVYGRGRLASRRGDDAGAIVQYEKAVELIDSAQIELDEVERAILSLAGAYDASGKTESAVALLESRLSMHAWSDEQRQTLSDVAAHFRGERPDIVLRRGQAEAKQTAGDLADRANAFDDAGRFDEARALYERASRLAPDDPEILYNYGVACAKQNDPDLQAESIALYRRALQIEPAHRAAHANLTPMLLEAGDHAAAAKHARTAIRLGLSSPGLCVMLGAICLELSRPEEAFGAFIIALHLAAPHERWAIEEHLSGVIEESAGGRFSEPNGESVDLPLRLATRLADRLRKRFVRVLTVSTAGVNLSVAFACDDGVYRAVFLNDTIRVCRVSSDEALAVVPREQAVADTSGSA